MEQKATRTANTIPTLFASPGLRASASQDIQCKWQEVLFVPAESRGSLSQDTQLEWRAMKRNDWMACWSITGYPDQYQYLGNCTPTPPPTQQVITS